MRRAATPQQTGFTLIEVLVALIVTGVGLLGLAKLQALVYANTNTASERSLAAIETSSMVSAMRANRAYWAKLTPPVTVTVTQTTVTSSDANLAAGLVVTVGNPTTYCQVGGGGNLPCSKYVLAAYDLQTWANSLNSLLPGATASISCQPPQAPLPANSPVGCTIQVSWVEHTAAANTQSQGIAMAAPTYSLYVVP